jgi:uncharacterized membrane-anchored protein
MIRGLIVALIHVLLVLSIAGKYVWDRGRLPRQWYQAAPYDPDSPLRGRYVSLRLVNPPADRVDQGVVFFIPEHVSDPSRREKNEELWVEVTVPPNGPLRPVQLGVKKDGVITPLDLR